MTEAEKGPTGQSKFIFSEILSTLLERLVNESPNKNEALELEKRKKIVEQMHKIGDEKATGIKYEKDEAKKFTKTVQSKQENITSWMKQWGKENKYQQRLPLKQAQNKLEAALAVSKDNITWSGVQKVEDVKSSVVAEFLSTVSLLPKDVAEDPNVFFRLTSRFAASLSEDPVARAQEIHILNKAILHQEDLRNASPDQGFTLNKEDTIFTLRGVVIYDPELDIDVKPKAAFFLRKQQEIFDQNRSGDINYEKEVLRRRRQVIEEGKFNVLKKRTDKEGNKFNKSDPQVVQTEDVAIQIQRIKRRLEEIAKEGTGSNRSGRYFTPEQITGVNIEGKKWLDDIELPPALVESIEYPGVMLDKSPLHALYNELNDQGDNPREDYLSDAHKRLNALVEGSVKPILDEEKNIIGRVYQITDIDIEPLKIKLEQTYKTMYGERNDRNPVNMEALKTIEGRESQFYKIMSQLTNNPNLSSRDLLDLPFTTKWDSFVHALGEIEFDKTKLPLGMSLSDARASVIARYTNLRETLTASHDLDFQARHSAGDIKSYKGALTYFQNHYFIEAVKDPLSQEAARCYEETLKQAIDNNGGWLPSSFATYNPDLGFCPWDKATKDLIIQRAKAGQIHEIERDLIGNPKKDRLTEQYIQKEKYSFKEDEYGINRLNAAMRMGKGTGLVSMRLLEMFAFTKIPGFNTRPGGAVFSSAAYEGIARYLNPMDALFGKFKMGDQRHGAYFAAMVGVEQSDIMSWINNRDAKQFEKIQEMFATGELEGWLRKKYPKDADARVKRLLDASELFAFSGELGPLSQWRTIDSTLRMTDFERERLGGSMRIQRAGAFGTNAASEEFKNNPIDKMLQSQDHNWGNLSKKEKKARREKLIADNPEFAKAVRDREYYRMLRSERKRKPFDEKANEYADAYRVFVYAQMAERSPVILAHGIKDHYHTEMLGNTETPKLLRTVIIEDILKNDTETQKMLRKQYLTNHDNLPTNPDELKDILQLNMARDVIATSTPTIPQTEFQLRVNALEDDVMLLQRIAMEDGKDGMPREIQQKDLKSIIGTRTLIWNGEKFASIDESTRRKQTWEYVQTVRDRVLGKDKTSKYWHDKIGACYDEESLVIKSPKAVDELMTEANNNKLLLDSTLLAKRDPIHMGTEDLQWSYLDLYTLGERSPARRGNDLENRVNTTNLEIEYLSMLRPHPDMDELAKQLGKIKLSEDNHDPKESHKIVWLHANATGQLYRQSQLGYVPFIGKILPKLGVTISPIQAIEGPDDAVAWSANNTHQFIEKVRNQAGLPARRINQLGELEDYNIHSLEHNLGATKRIAIAEAIIVGYSLAAVAIGLSAVTKSVEDEKKK